MVAEPETELVERFNAAINAADLVGLTALMTEDHRFVDSAGSAVEGREACRAAWSSFFDSFPGYCNVLDSVEVVTPGHVLATGRSESQTEALRGQARWHATIRGGYVAEWRVEDAPTE